MDKIIQKLVARQSPVHVHLLGICGCGMSGLAHMLAQAGHRASGSDLVECPEMLKLRAVGVDARSGHSALLGALPDLCVVSTAISPTNPELVALREAGVPTIRRGEFLAALVNAHRGVAVAGMHGKTTTSAMIASIFKRAGLQPSYCIGGDVPVLGGKSAWNTGDWFVAEADESDGTLSSYAPHLGVVLNIEEEHLEYYSDLDAIARVFREFATKVSGKLFYCGDDVGAVRVCSDLPNSVSFGANGNFTFSVADVRFEGKRSKFLALHLGQPLGTVSLRIPGMHNVTNALAAAAVASEAGVPFACTAEALAEFSGARRRFDKKFESSRITVVDDYAHHPTEIRATIGAARLQGAKRVVVAFQPHRFTRTKWLRHQFASAFAMADKLFVTELYAASELPIEGIGGRTIFDAVRATGQRNVEFEPSLERLAARLVSEARDGDLILVMGAGSITQVAERAAQSFAKLDETERVAESFPSVIAARAGDDPGQELRRVVSDETVIRVDEPMAAHTTLRVGGIADFWVEPASESDLAAVLLWSQQHRIGLTVVGRGSNLLVKDGGVRGAVVRLKHPVFSRIRICDGNIVAGAGALLRQVVHAARDASLSGLEFLEGIPGSLGGALRMNAGAMGRAMFDLVESVRCMDSRGNIFEVRRDEVEVRYRCCALFEAKNGHSKVALSAVLKGQPADAAQIRRTEQALAQKRRASQPGAPSAGCVFKNPSTDLPAGRLIDEMGFKGKQVGGARVSEMHANFIVTQPGAKAGDVLQLILAIQDKAARERGVVLETEVQILGEG